MDHPLDGPKAEQLHHYSPTSGARVGQVQGPRSVLMALQCQVCVDLAAFVLF
jgi:hypothetical protein